MSTPAHAVRQMFAVLMQSIIMPNGNVNRDSGLFPLHHLTLPNPSGPASFTIPSNLVQKIQIIHCVDKSRGPRGTLRAGQIWSLGGRWVGLLSGGNLSGRGSRGSRGPGRGGESGLMRVGQVKGPPMLVKYYPAGAKITSSAPGPVQTARRHLPSRVV